MSFGFWKIWLMAADSFADTKTSMLMWGANEINCREIRSIDYRYPIQYIIILLWKWLKQSVKSTSLPVSFYLSDCVLMYPSDFRVWFFCGSGAQLNNFLSTASNPLMVNCTLSPYNTINFNISSLQRQAVSKVIFSWFKWWWRKEAFAWQASCSP